MRGGNPTRAKEAAMKTIRSSFVLLLAVLMLVGMALPVCAEELALDAEAIVEETASKPTPESEVTSEPELTPESEVTSAPEATTEPEVTPEPTATPEPVPADAATPENTSSDEAAPLALESESETIILTTAYSSMLQGDTFRLTEDLNLHGKTVRLIQTTVILDLNGHTLTVGSLQLYANVTVTLTDSIGTGCINGPINANTDSTLVLNGGTVTSTEKSTLGGKIITGKGTTVFNGPVHINANTTVSGGVFKGYVENSGTIDGGEFDGDVYTDGTISGGTFNGSVTSKYALSMISGGIFKGNVSTYGSISGGVFCGSVPADKLPKDESVYTVTFDLNGGSGSIPDQVLVNTDTATAHEPADPTRDGYAFLGWYNNKNQLYDFSKPVTADVSLIALWTPVYYGITYKGDETPGEDAPKYYAYDSYTALPKSTQPGFTLQWFESADFTGDPVTAIKASVYGNKTFYGQMVANNYTVTYDTGESITTPDSKTKLWTDTVLDGVATPSKSGHTFGGWKCGNVVVGPNMTVAELAKALGKDDSIGSFALTATWIPDGNTGGDDTPTGGGDDNPSGSSGSSPAALSKPVSSARVPKTGDDSMIVLWLALAAVSAPALGYVSLRKRKN